MEPLATKLPESGHTQNAYSRKQKSLGLLCSNFLSLYNREGVQSVGLDDAANRLGVERRRIYDIVNILESVGVLARKAKNQYTWKGFGAIPRALDKLKEEGFKDNRSSSDGNDHGKYSEDEDERYSSQNTGSQPEKTSQNSTQNSSSSSKPDNRREKSLGLLTQNFVKLFLCSNMELISLDDAAKILLGDGHSSTIMRTKVRRLYDIANVLTSMNLIEKTNQTENRKPAFRWTGLKGKLENDSSTSLNKFNKRSFGTEITNIDFKRSRLESSSSAGKSNFVMKIQEPVPVKLENLEYDSDRSIGRDSKVKTYEFGPFAPVNVSRVQTTESKPNQVHDWENLATVYRPQYQNPALKELFVHYKDAWHTWHTEVAKKPV
ncbi:unnamed protein product [Rhodiola kirilowii]